ncbi:MAG: molybdate ABC transporter substrate-binding protein [Alphaproteobacteria bacterium]
MIDRRKIWATIAMALTPFSASADQVTVAVATNFTEVVEHLSDVFEQTTNHTVVIVSGSTGKLYAQISNGAPFDVFMAADQNRPALLVDGGHADQAITYAIGQLALWSANPDQVTGPKSLEAKFRHLAIANPDLAPYGLAAKQVLTSMAQLAVLEKRLVLGENIGQTYALVASGNAELGFVALSYVQSPRNKIEGSTWIVPASLHDPIKQDAVLLNRAAENPAALAFLAFLQTENTRAQIRNFGYMVE